MRSTPAGLLMSAVLCAFLLLASSGCTTQDSDCEDGQPCGDCTPSSCAEAGAQCGELDDGCECGTSCNQSCGTCGDGLTCVADRLCLPEAEPCACDSGDGCQSGCACDTVCAASEQRLFLPDLAGQIQETVPLTIALEDLDNGWVGGTDGFMLRRENGIWDSSPRLTEMIIYDSRTAVSYSLLARSLSG